MVDVISSLCSQLSVAAERIEGLTFELERTSGGEFDVIRRYYSEMRLAELENMQKLTLELTKQIVDSETMGETPDGQSEAENKGDDGT